LNGRINIQRERLGGVTYLRETEPSKEDGVSNLGISFENFFIPGDETDGTSTDLYGF